MQKILNLTDPTNSQIKYQIQKFPDGQQNIVIHPDDLNGYYYVDADTECWKEKKINNVEIKSRLNNWLDLELIVCAVASLRSLGVKEIHLYTPYIVGARSDRKFQDGGNNYLKDVICPVINSLNFKSVTCIDPHSDCLEMGIDRLHKISNDHLVRWSFTQGKGIENPIIISPDSGASKKIYKLAYELTEQIGYKGDIITCSKERDADGKIIRTVVPLDAGEYTTQDFVVIDDICDGGATFTAIAEELREIRTQYSKQKIYLIVTHGIFSKGFDKLAEYFDGIYCTNSVKDIADGKIVNTFSKHKQIKSLVKQLNVF